MKSLIAVLAAASALAGAAAPGMASADPQDWHNGQRQDDRGDRHDRGDRGDWHHDRNWHGAPVFTGYYWQGRHWRNRHWDCRVRYGRRVCHYRYW